MVQQTVVSERGQQCHLTYFFFFFQWKVPLDGILLLVKYHQFAKLTIMRLQLVTWQLTIPVVYNEPVLCIIAVT